jgi:hypothetical protein
MVLPAAIHGHVRETSSTSFAQVVAFTEAFTAQNILRVHRGTGRNFAFSMAAA